MGSGLGGQQMNVEIEYPEDFALRGEARMRFDRRIKKMLNCGRRLDVVELECYCEKAGLHVVADLASHERSTLDVLSAATMRDSPREMQHAFLYWLGTYLGVCIRAKEDVPGSLAHRILSRLTGWREWELWAVLAFVGVLGAISVMAYDDWLHRSEMAGDAGHLVRAH